MSPYPSSPPGMDTIAAARAGDERAWAQLYDDIAPRLAAYLRGMQLADVDDVVSDTLVRMVRAFHTFDGGIDELRAWAYAIARNARMDFHRRESRHTERVSAELATLASGTGQAAASLTPLDAGAIDRDRVLRLLAALTDRQREVMLLRLVGDMTIAQVAYVMGEQQDAIKQLQRRATGRLRELIAQEEATDATD